MNGRGENVNDFIIRSMGDGKKNVVDKFCIEKSNIVFSFPNTGKPCYQSKSQPCPCQHTIRGRSSHLDNGEKSVHVKPPEEIHLTFQSIGDDQNEVLRNWNRIS